ncbi:aldo/keto reductase [Jannaschia seohaensis]|uniref:Predicted oxidoreductase n=1 Tax=Jannaschia seohaensis TaxID=475081 RepID=A0A2Y9B1G7_9RHOB|nr:aldo/keto reductase [Jannaschia seohaensis]PWJ16540.1 aryl-alcohol dehydrogenase-like predicted oxidoreductase [Jannaschia seohaensis]SSA48777.1 Predicted oxidoreductase [Jannaschia seohaensis]
MVAELAPGHTISRVIRGGWQLAGDHGAVDRAQAIADMERFVEAGVTTFDCADIYTGVEEMIGDFLADLRPRRPDLADKLVVHTKFVPDLALLPELSARDVEAIIDRSRDRLRVDRLDLVQFYWWDMSLGDPARGLEPLLELREKGKIRNLGVTNWDIEDTRRFTEAGFPLVSAQVQYSVLDRRPENGYAEWCAGQGIQLLCYGTLAGGFLTEKWLGAPDPGFSFENRSLVKYRLIIDEFGPWERFQRLLAALAAVGARHGASLSSVATAWALDRPNVAAAIVGARYARHLPKTLEAMELRLTDADRAEIGAVLAEAEGPNGPVFGLERDRSGRHGRIMKYNLNADPNAGLGG